MVLITGKHKVVTSNSTTMKALARSPRICIFIQAMKNFAIVVTDFESVRERAGSFVSIDTPRCSKRD
jgi:hypothetical protein